MADHHLGVRRNPRTATIIHARLAAPSPLAGTPLNLPLQTPSVEAGIEEEDGRNRDELPSESSEETTQQGGDEEKAITQIKV